MGDLLMDYKTYLESKLTEYTISNELKFNYTGTDTHVLIKQRGGGYNYGDSQILPIQLLVFTYDVEEVVNTLNNFVKDYSGTRFVQELEYVRQYYETPVVISSGQSGGNNHYSQVSLLGQLHVSTNISDIKTVEIDGTEYFTTLRTMSYVTIVDTQSSQGEIGETDVINGMNKFVCNLENKNNALCVKVANIRQGNIDANSEFAIKLTYTDNDRIETYTMKLASATINSDNSTSPVLALEFMG